MAILRVVEVGRAGRLRDLAALETRRRTQRRSLSSQKRRYCRFGRKRRLVLLFACETLFPTIGPLPVIWQTRDISNSLAWREGRLRSGRPAGVGRCLQAQQSQ